MPEQSQDYDPESGKTGRRRGRPVQMCAEDRESLVLDCAIELLSRKGPEDVTMTDIARSAGMSKRTLYSLYRSREELLGAGLARISQRLFRPLLPEERNNSLEERLGLLLTFDRKRERPEVVIEMLRAVICEARTYPELGRTLTASGPGLVVDLVRKELTLAADAGEIELAADAIPSAAQLLVDMVMGNTIHCLLDPDHILPQIEQHEARRDQAIGIFLNGVRPRKT